MEMIISDIKKAKLLTFEKTKNSVFYSKVDDDIKGIIVDDYFLDFETKELHPLFYCDNSWQFNGKNTFAIKYAYSIESIYFKEEEKSVMLEKAWEVYNWYCELKELEANGKIISFQNQKIKRRIG